MRGICIVIILLVLCPIFGTWPAVAQEIKGPLMVMEERFFNFKEVKEGAILEHTFKVLNKGNQTLEIKKVQPG